MATTRLTSAARRIVPPSWQLWPAPSTVRPEDRPAHTMPGRQPRRDRPDGHHRRRVPDHRRSRTRGRVREPTETDAPTRTEPAGTPSRQGLGRFDNVSVAHAPTTGFFAPRLLVISRSRMDCRRSARTAPGNRGGHRDTRRSRRRTRSSNLFGTPRRSSPDQTAGTGQLPPQQSGSPGHLSAQVGVQPQTFGVPPPPQLWPLGQSQERVPPQPSGTSPHCPA